MKRTLAAAALGLLVLVGCRSDRIALAYRFEPGSQTTYRMTAEARANWDIGGAGSGSYRVVFDVIETIQEIDGDEVVVAVEMTPVEVDEHDLPSPGAERRSFSMRIGPGGELLQVLELNGVEAEALDPDELVFIGTYRPPLPEEPVGLGDTWEAQQQLQLESVFQQVVTNGELDRLDRDADGRIAELDHVGQGPLVWTTTLPQGEADLTGLADIRSHAVFDIDRGALREAASETHGSFEVRIVPGGNRAPIIGRLELDLELQVVRR